MPVYPTSLARTSVICNHIVCFPRQHVAVATNGSSPIAERGVVEEDEEDGHAKTASLLRLREVASYHQEHPFLPIWQSASTRETKDPNTEPSHRRAEVRRRHGLAPDSLLESKHCCQLALWTRRLRRSIESEPQDIFCIAGAATRTSSFIVVGTTRIRLVAFLARSHPSQLTSFTICIYYNNGSYTSGYAFLVSLRARVVHYHQPENFHGEVSSQYWLLAISNTCFEVKFFSYLVREVGEGSKVSKRSVESSVYGDKTTRAKSSALGFGLLNDRNCPARSRS